MYRMWFHLVNAMRWAKCAMVFLSLSVHKKVMSAVTNQPTTRCRVLLQNLTVAQLAKKFPTFYGTWTFITVFTTAFHWSLSWARCTQPTPSQPIPLRSIQILYLHLLLVLPSCLFPSGFPYKILYTFIISPMCATCLAPIILPYFITLIILGEEH